MGNAASLIEARHIARKEIRDERENARLGLAEMDFKGRMIEAGEEKIGIIVAEGELENLADVLGTAEEIAMLRRLGLNRIEVRMDLKNLHEHTLLAILFLTNACDNNIIRGQVMKVLKSMVGSIDPRAPMLVIKYATFKEHGCIPRSNDNMTVPLSQVPEDAKVRCRISPPIFFSHHIKKAGPAVFVAPPFRMHWRGC
jgi:hypothetical protein